MRPGQNKKKSQENKKAKGFPTGLLFAVLILGAGIGGYFFLQNQEETKKDAVELLLTKAELAQYAGQDSNKPIYLAILGEIFDVSAGKFYKPDGSYHFFAGVDASRSFVTGDFKNDLNDNVDDLKAGDIAGIKGWHGFFVESQDYHYVGRVIGNFYDAEGKPTEALGKVQEKLAEHEVLAAAQEKAKEDYPLCNSAWQREKELTRFWCTPKSGGKERDWAGYPRKVFNPQTQRTRCGCAKDPNDKNPDLGMYEGCAPKSPECYAQKEKKEKKSKRP